MASTVPLSTKLYYGVGAIAYGVKDNGLAFILLIYYSQVLGLEERLVGLAMFIALIVDAISDPIVGHISDNFRSKWGRRHPFLYAAALPAALSYFFLWNPPESLSQSELFFYLVFLVVLVRLMITFFEVPNSAMVAEFTQDYDERTQILAYRNLLAWWGGLTIAVLNFTVFLNLGDPETVGQLNQYGYEVYGTVAACIIFVSMMVSALGTHRNIPHLRQPPPKQPFKIGRAVLNLQETLSNRSLFAILASGFFSFIAIGFSTSLNIYWSTFYWELESTHLGIITLAGFPAAFIAFVMAPKLGQWYGKRNAAIGVSLTAVSLGPVPILLRNFDLFVSNESAFLVPILVTHALIEIALATAAGILVGAMVADIVEESELKTGRRSEGLFFAARDFMQKAVAGGGLYVSTMVLAFVGFPEGAKPGEVEEEVLSNLVAIYVPVLLTLYFTSVFFLTRYRISRESYEGYVDALSESMNENLARGTSFDASSAQNRPAEEK